MRGEPDRPLLTIIRWGVAGLLIVLGHLGVAYAMLPPAPPPLSTGDLPAAILVDLPPMPPETAPPAASQPDPGMFDAAPSMPSLPDFSLVPDMPDQAAAKVPVAVPLPRRKPPQTQTAEAGEGRARPQPAPPRPDTAPPAAAPTTAEPGETADASFGSGATTTALPSSWKQRLLAHLERHKRYPSEARVRREEGTALLEFSMDRQGRVLAVSMARSSGHDDLDAEVFAMIRRAEPLPPVPDEIPDVVLKLIVPVRFNIR